MAILCFSIQSCVDEKYDLTKIDTEAVVLKNTVIPIGNIEPVKIGDMLDITESGTNLIVQDSNGNIYFSFEGDSPVSASFTVPEFSIDFMDGTGEERKLILNLPSSIAGMGTEQLKEVLPDVYNAPISFESLTGQKASIRKVIQIDDECYLPKFVNDIKEVSLESSITYQFSLNVKDNNGGNINAYGGILYIKSGFTIDFPDYFTIAKNDNCDGYEIVDLGENKNILTFTKDFPISANESIALNIQLTKAEIPSGCIVDGMTDSDGDLHKKIYFDAENPANMILAEGDVYIMAKDFVKIPKAVEMTMNLSFDRLNVKSALVSLNVEETLPDQSFELPEVPDILRNNDIIIDLYDPVISFAVNNPTELDIMVGGCLHGYRDGVHKMSMYFGEDGVNEPFKIPSKYNGNINFSRRGESGMIPNPGISEFFKILPDQIRISDITFSISDNYFTIVPGQNLSCSLNYFFNVPLSFGPELSILFEHEISDIDIDLSEYGLSKAIISFETISTVPLALEVQAEVIDNSENKTSDLTIDVDGSVAPGTLSDPSVPSKITITLSSEKGINFDKLKLIYKATCPQAYCGYVLNTQHGLEIQNMKVTLPDGVSFDFEEFLPVYSE